MSHAEDDDASRRRRRPRKPPGRRPLSEGNAEETREEIRRHAVRLFNQRGYAAVSIEDILEATGLTRGTLYYHFTGKSDIFVASMLALARAIQQETERVVSRQDWTVAQRIERLTSLKREAEEQARARDIAPPDEYGEFDFSEKMMAEAMRHLSPHQQALIASAMEGTHDLTRRLLAEGIACGELRPLPVEVMDFALWQLFFQPMRMPDTEARSRAEQEALLLSLYFEGIVTR